jgi:hypothetical protein
LDNLVISSELYDKLEQRAVAGLSIPVIQAFRPVTYLQFGYPVRVSTESELIRYVDHNFESEVPHIFSPGAKFPASGFVNSFSIDEHELLSQVRERVARLTTKYFERAIRPVTTPLVQVAPFRVINELATRSRKARLTIFEAGPGLGYLGALLALKGYRYISFDVTQAMYLWQNRLFAEFAAEDFAEEAFAPSSMHYSDKTVVHLPWWRFVDWFDSTPVKFVDVVYSNSNLCEMSPLALRMLLHISKPLLAASEVGLFCFFGTGFPGQTSVEGLNTEFLNQGYRRVNELPFSAYVPDRRDTSAIVKAFSKGIPLYNPSGRTERRTASEVVSLKRSEAPLDVAATAWYYGWKPPFID